MNVVETVDPARRIARVRPPLPGPGVCGICRGPASEGRGYCWCCRRVCALLGEVPGSIPYVLPMVAFAPGDVWNVMLRRYKDAPVVAARRHFAKLLSVETEHFFTAHGDCLRVTTGGFDSYCVVPTTRPHTRTMFPHPLEAVLAGVSAFEPLGAIRLAPFQPSFHLRPRTEAFVADDPTRVAGRRVLVVEDSWVTGARALSAVVALRSARAVVTAVLVIGRSVDPSASLLSRSWWTDLRRASATADFVDGEGPCSDGCLMTVPGGSVPAK